MKGININGVKWDMICKKYQATMFYKGKLRHLGSYDNLILAAIARRKGEIQYIGKNKASRIPSQAGTFLNDCGITI